ncbi:MAG TPA: helix-turn-helix domain-containing protein [Herpetosiphonaceae bacterium]|nr:helix-turn-helix domain-containing protein [Herpetosiphonaceae bacterium]
MAEYTITELSALSGVNRRNIHFYIQQGLLPPADGAGLGARYTDEHLLRLRAIPVLRDRGLRLDAIREQLAGLDPAAVQSILAQPEPRPRPAPPAPTAGETVTRYRLAPGVEVLIGPGADPAWLGRLAELAAGIRNPGIRPTDSHNHGGES